MGWDISRFLEKDNIVEDLLCTICTDIIEDPVQTNCEHTFCRECISTWLEGGQRTCPEDRQQLSSNDLRPPSRLTKQLLNNLIVRCKNYSDGCRLMSKFEDMPRLMEHETNLCKVAQNPREIQVKHQKESNDLQMQISKLEDSLSLEKGLHSITIEDNANVIEELLNTIQDLERKLREGTKNKYIFQPGFRNYSCHF
jgi:hypothetical protein